MPHPFDTNMIRPCGASFSYCNGNCADCEVNNTYATNSTDAISRYCVGEQINYEVDAFGKPSKEAYEKAKQDKEFAATSLSMCRKRRDELIDALAKEREAEKLYLELYEKHREIVRKYEIYEELEKNG